MYNAQNTVHCHSSTTAAFVRPTRHLDSKPLQLASGTVSVQSLSSGAQLLTTQHAVPLIPMYPNILLAVGMYTSVFQYGNHEVPVKSMLLCVVY